MIIYWGSLELYPHLDWYIYNISAIVHSGLPQISDFIWESHPTIYASHTASIYNGIN